MKQVTIIIPDGKVNLSSIAGSFEILKAANKHWRKMGHNPELQISLAGFINELNWVPAFFPFTPKDIKKISKTGVMSCRGLLTIIWQKTTKR